jgi:WW domain
MCDRYGDVAGAKQTPRQQPLVSVNYGNYPPQASNDSDTSAYASYDPYSSTAQHQQQHHQQQQQFASAQPPQPYGQPAVDQSGGGYHASGQHPNFMDYTPQQSYAASSYQTLPYASAPALAPQVCRANGRCPDTLWPKHAAVLQISHTNCLRLKLYASIAVLLLQASVPVHSAWQMHHAPDGRPYWANAQTGVTQWEPPAAS